MLSIVPVRISAVKTLVVPGTIGNLLDYLLSVACSANAITTIVLAKVADKNRPTTLTSRQVPLSRPQLAPQDNQGHLCIYQTHRCHTSQAS